MKTPPKKSDLFDFAGGVAKRLISPDTSLIAKALLQVLDIKNFSRELLEALLEHAGKQKDILVEAMAGEFSKYLSRLNLADLSRQVMEGLTIEVNATVNVRRKVDARSVGTVKISSSVRRKKR